MPQTIQLSQKAGWTSLGNEMRLRAPGLKGNLIWRPPAERSALS